MSARVVAPARGAQWLLDGARLFRASPLGWLVLVFTYLMGTMLLSVFPFIGPAAVSVLVPAFSVGFMAASRAASRQQTVELTMLFAGFRERLPAMLVLGCVYAGGFALAIAASSIADGGALLGLLFAPPEGPGAERGDGNVLAGMLASAVFYLPTMMMLWFAPVLVAWHGLAPPKALFYSLMAFWLNLRAFVVYGIALVLALFVVVGTVTLLAALLPGAAASARSLVFPLALAFMPILFASYYASYRDVFGAQESA